MATIRLIPSTYSTSNSTLTVSSASNMYANTDNTTYATASTSTNNTTSYYLYIKGFDFDSVPAGAIVNSFTIKIKAYEKSLSTSSSYRPYLCNNTTTITGSCNSLSTSAQVLTFTGVSATWDTIKGYGSNFGIRLCYRRSSRNTKGYIYVYGAEILVDYTLPDPADITVTPTTSNPTTNITINQGDVLKIDITNSSSSSYTYTTTSSYIDIAEVTLNPSISIAGNATERVEVTGIKGGISTISITNNNGSYARKATINLTVVGAEPADITVTPTTSNPTTNITINKGDVLKIDVTNSSSSSYTYTTTSSATNVAEVTLNPSISIAGNATERVEVTGIKGGISTISITNNNGSYARKATINLTVVEKFYIKESGAWDRVNSVYQKINGTWVIQYDLSSIFSVSTTYVKAN